MQFINSNTDQYSEKQNLIICRACLNSIQDTIPYGIHTMDSQIRLWLQDPTLENSVIEDEFPKNVCHSCHQTLENFLKFYQMCLRSRELYTEMMKKGQRTTSGMSDNSDTLNASAKEVNCDWLEFDFVALPKSLLTDRSKTDCKLDPNVKEKIPSPATSKKKEDCIVSLFDLNDACSDHSSNDNIERASNSFATCKAGKIQISAPQDKSSKITVVKIDRKQKSHNEDKPQHICEECGKVYPSLARLIEHQYSHKPKTEYPYHCKECNKAFKHRQTFMAHQMRHAGIKNFQCPYCDMKKTTKSELRAHMNYHTKERQWLCPKCPLIFSSAANLRRHDQVVHQGIRRYSCSYCSTTFGKQESLKHHEMRHTGEKPHVCLICDKRFIQSVALKAHMKIHNKG
ncbi:myoneurin [Stomoxys calcitrans]|nr:myoneurin [Stomoxys calcitrans]